MVTSGRAKAQCDSEKKKKRKETKMCGKILCYKCQHIMQILTLRQCTIGTLTDKWSREKREHREKQFHS